MKKIFLIVFSIYVIAPTGVFAFDEAKVKQMAEQSIIIGFRGLTISKDSDIENILKNTNPGGVILFDYDSPSNGKIVRNIKNKKWFFCTNSNRKKASIFRFKENICI